MTYYRVTSGGRSIFEVVEEDCPPDHEYRARKPDDSWLPKLSKKLRKFIFYWTEDGMEKYVESGLKDWHELVTVLPIEVKMLEELEGEIIYKDKYRVIIK